MAIPVTEAEIAAVFAPKAVSALSLGSFQQSFIRLDDYKLMTEILAGMHVLAGRRRHLLRVSLPFENAA